MIKKNILQFIYAIFVLVSFQANVLAQMLPVDTLTRSRMPFMGIRPAVGYLNTDPNLGSIHVNRDTNIRKYTPTQLVEEIFVKGGSCASVSNVTLRSHGWNGTAWTDTDNRGLGHFTRGTSNFEFEEGLVLSTGGLVSIEGPNELPSGVANASLPTMGDADLAGLVSGGITNVSVLEFDFVPTSNMISFRYVFASEEYLQYANTTFNDVFGFFVSRPGISGSQNIALLPNSSIVSIDNVNWGRVDYNQHNCATPSGLNPMYPSDNPVNPNYYINIPSSAVWAGNCPIDSALYRSMEFNGRTVVLTATYSVVPCSTYRLKLAVGNIADINYQSGVFLEARSFDLGDNLINHGNNIEGMDYVYRGCAVNKLVVNRGGGGSNNIPQIVHLTYGGTAVNGVDISLPSGAVLPTTVTIPANQDTVEIHYRVNTPPTGYGTFTITSDCPCGGGGAAYTKTIYIFDTTVFQANALPSCPNINSGKKRIDILSGNSQSYEISIDGGLTWSSQREYTGLAAGNYTVHVRDSGGCNIGMHNLTIGVANADAGIDQFLQGTIFTMNAPPLLLGEVGRWSVVSGKAKISDTTNPNTSVAVNGFSATLKWTLYYSDCELSDTVKLTVIPLEVDICPNDSLTFVAEPNNCGSLAAFQWIKNGVPISGANDSTYRYAPADGDTIVCMVVCDTNCVSPDTIFSRPVIVKYYPATMLTYPSSICEGTTVQLSPTTGGTWTSIDNSVATVTSDGIATGVTAGLARFVFISSLTGCPDTTTTVTIVAFPIVDTIVATVKAVCTGAKIVLFCATPNGVWTLSNDNAEIDGSNTANSVTIEGKKVGQVYVTYTVGAVPCQSNITFLLRIIPATQQPDIKIGFEE